MNATIEPSQAIELLLRAATAQREKTFVVFAVRTYFRRVMNASMRKLLAYGLRPVVTPIAAELALTRARQAKTFSQFMEQLIDDDAEVANLVLRAINLYCMRLINEPLEVIEREFGVDGLDLCNAAQIVQRNLSCIYPVAARHP